MAKANEKPGAKRPRRKTQRSETSKDYVVVSAVKHGLREAPTGHYVDVTRHPTDVSTDARISRHLTGRIVKSEKLIGLVRGGLPVFSVERVRQGLGIESTESMLSIVGMSPRTYARRKKLKQALTPLESDRLYRLAKIESLAETVFGEQAAANDWLQSPNRALGARPLDLLDTEAGTEQVERVLARIEHGVYS
ncbi:MAG: DUF2384 domain-containing protein [Candidatus Thiodiazotropha sp. (ex Dulcina madagascariensis)]|nr:DUF2384 domain-containing protein [Candidatus Thiodiazotropha sp. (ex Dulcina madagascariensis)]